MINRILFSYARRAYDEQTTYYYYFRSSIFLAVSLWNVFYNLLIPYSINQSNQILFSSCVLTCPLLLHQFRWCHKLVKFVSWVSWVSEFQWFWLGSDGAMPRVLRCIGCTYAWRCCILCWCVPFYCIFHILLRLCSLLHGVRICGRCSIVWAAVGVYIVSLYTCSS